MTFRHFSLPGVTRGHQEESGETVRVGIVRLGTDRVGTIGWALLGWAPLGWTPLGWAPLGHCWPTAGPKNIFGDMGL